MKKTLSNLFGFTLIETLVALLVLSIGLLGLAALQATSLAFNTESYLRTQATLMVYDIVDKMRANPAGVAAGNYDVLTPGDAANKQSAYASCLGSSCKCEVGSACTSPNLALYDLGTWYAKMASAEVLPGASDPAQYATISRDGANQVTITINWIERDVPRTQQWIIQL